MITPDIELDGGVKAETAGEIAAKIAIKLSAGGSVQPMTLAAIPLDNLIETLKKNHKSPW